MRFAFYLAAVFATVFGLASSCPAQSLQTFVSGLGNNFNPCNRTAPCASFSTALTNTVPGGEIDCLDDGDFGAATITQSVSIICDALNGGIYQDYYSSNITVNLPASGDRVVLSGLNLDGLVLGAPSPAANGVLISGLGTVTIRNSQIRNFTTAGVSLTGGANARVFISNSLLTNDGSGIIVQGASGVANYATLIDTIVDGNANYGAQIAAGNKLTIERCTITGTTVSVSNTGGTFISVGPSSYFSGSATPTTTQAYR